MRFLVDANLPPALARALTGWGYDAVHVADIGLEAASDLEIWEVALKEARVVVTKDEDFFQRRVLVDYGPQILWVRVPNVRRQRLLDLFGTVLADVIRSLSEGESIVELIDHL